jgi:hypothetical protein
MFTNSQKKEGMIALKWEWKRILVNIQNEINMYKPRKWAINANWNQNDIKAHHGQAYSQGMPQPTLKKNSLISLV